MISASVLGAGIVAGLFPFHSASADESILLEDVTLKDDDGNVLVSFKEGERIETFVTDEGATKAKKSYSTYEIDPEYLLTVTQTEQTNWKAKDLATFYATPDFFSSAVGTLTADAFLKVIDSSVSGWLQIESDEGIKGWIHLSQVEKVKAEKQVKEEAYILKSQEVADVSLFKGDKVQLVGYQDGKYEVLFEDGKYQIPKEDISYEKPKETNERIVHTLFEFAKNQLGKPYVWGGNGVPGYDCSGYTKDAYAQIGIDLPRTAATQSNMGVAVSLADIQAGDMMFFETYKPGVSHVAIYMGDGKMIHAAGQQVHISDISESYWSQRYLFSRSVL